MMVVLVNNDHINGLRIVSCKIRFVSCPGRTLFSAPNTLPEIQISLSAGSHINSPQSGTACFTLLSFFEHQMSADKNISRTRTYRPAGENGIVAHLKGIKRSFELKEIYLF